MLRSLKNEISVFNWNYLKSVVFLTKTVLEKQYSGSFLGVLWSLIQPAISISVLAIVFTHIVRFDVKNYIVYLMSGMLPWIFIQSAIFNSSSSLTNRSSLIKNGCILPKTMFIVSDTLVAVYVLFISFIIMYFISVGFIIKFSFSIFWLPVVLLPAILFVIFSSIAIAYTAPYMKDINYLVNSLLGVLFWSVPIVYPASSIPPDMMNFFLINPFYIVIRPIQELVHGGAFPATSHLLLAFAVSLIAAIFAWAMHKLLKKNVVYYL